MWKLIKNSVTGVFPAAPSNKIKPEIPGQSLNTTEVEDFILIEDDSASNSKSLSTSINAALNTVKDPSTMTSAPSNSNQMPVNLPPMPAVAKASHNNLPVPTVLNTVQEAIPDSIPVPTLGSIANEPPSPYPPLFFAEIMLQMETGILSARPVTRQSIRSNTKAKIKSNGTPVAPKAKITSTVQPKTSGANAKQNTIVSPPPPAAAKQDTVILPARSTAHTAPLAVGQSTVIPPLPSAIVQPTSSPTPPQNRTTSIAQPRSSSVVAQSTPILPTYLRAQVAGQSAVISPPSVTAMPPPAIQNIATQPVHQNRVAPPAPAPVQSTVSPAAPVTSQNTPILPAYSTMQSNPPVTGQSAVILPLPSVIVQSTPLPVQQNNETQSAQAGLVAVGPSTATLSTPATPNNSHSPIQSSILPSVVSQSVTAPNLTEADILRQKVLAKARKRGFI